METEKKENFDEETGEADAQTEQTSNEANEQSQENAGQKRTKCEIYSRIVGYIRPTNQWNDGKEAEFEERKTFEVGNVC